MCAYNALVLGLANLSSSNKYMTNVCYWPWGSRVCKYFWHALSVCYSIVGVK